MSYPFFWKLDQRFVVIEPQRILLVGNSFGYYRCAVNGYISGFAKVQKQKLATSMVTIGGTNLDWHDVKSYLRPNAIASYTTLNDGNNKLSFNNYPGTLLSKTKCA